jgi:hypothetical protein
MPSEEILNLSESRTCGVMKGGNSQVVNEMKIKIMARCRRWWYETSACHVHGACGIGPTFA